MSGLHTTHSSTASLHNMNRSPSTNSINGNVVEGSRLTTTPSRKGTADRQNSWKSPSMTKAAAAASPATPVIVNTTPSTKVLPRPRRALTRLAEGAWRHRRAQEPF
jgi:hypothetical protein